jgi:hypothetical protein
VRELELPGEFNPAAGSPDGLPTAPPLIVTLTALSVPYAHSAVLLYPPAPAMATTSETE